jgi:hypothetical protein
MSKERPEILFLCVHNAGRSQMAAGFARKGAAGTSSFIRLGPRLERPSTRRSSKPCESEVSTSPTSHRAN